MIEVPNQTGDTSINTDWSKGSNNVANPERLPPGFARSIVNMDTTPGGRLTLRQGQERVYQGTNPRALLALGRKLLIADGTDLVEHDRDSGTTRVIRTIAPSGPMCGGVLNDRLYFCTTTEALEYDGSIVRRWGVPDATNDFAVAQIAGGLVPGYYRVAVTYTDEYGREGGTSAPMIYYADTGFTVTVGAAPAGCVTNLYVGSVAGDALYLQQVFTAAGTYTVNLVRDDTQALETFNLYAPTPGDIVVPHNGILAVARRLVVEWTMPMRTHLMDRTRGFVQYPSAVGAMVSAGGLFVSADKSYVLTGVETADVRQSVVAEYPAFPGTAVVLPDGTGSWATTRGQVMLEGDKATLLTAAHFVPAPADSGAAGVIDLHGSARVITSTNASRGPNRLAAADFFDAEITTP